MAVDHRFASCVESKRRQPAGGLPVWVPLEGTGDEEIPAVRHILQKRLPSFLAESMSGWKDDQARVSQSRQLVLRNHVARHATIVMQGSHSFHLGLQGQPVQRRILECLRGHNGDFGRLRCAKEALGSRYEWGEPQQHVDFGLFRPVGANGADTGLSVVAHISVGVPEPLNRAGAGGQRHGHLAFQ